MSEDDIKPISYAQERRIINYVDEQSLEISRAYQKRSIPVHITSRLVSKHYLCIRNLPTSHLRTLSAFLDAWRPLIFDLVMRIPPLEPSGRSRILLMLKMTGDLLDAIPGYSPFSGTNIAEEEELPAVSDTQDGDESPLESLYQFLTELDQAWVACLRCQAWDHVNRRGVDVELELDEGEEVEGAMGDDPYDDNRKAGVPDRPISNTPRMASLTSTDEVRLRSMLVTGMGAVEDWLEDAPTAMRSFAALFEETFEYLDRPYRVS